MKILSQLKHLAGGNVYVLAAIIVAIVGGITGIIYALTRSSGGGPGPEPPCNVEKRTMFNSSRPLSVVLKQAGSNQIFYQIEFTATTLLLTNPVVVLARTTKGFSDSQYRFVIEKSKTSNDFMINVGFYTLDETTNTYEVRSKYFVDGPVVELGKTYVVTLKFVRPASPPDQLPSLASESRVYVHVDNSSIPLASDLRTNLYPLTGNDPEPRLESLLEDPAAPGSTFVVSRVQSCFELNI